MKWAVSILLAFFSLIAFAQTPKQSIQDPSQLLGKKVNVGRLPLCTPRSYTPDLQHSGKIATVTSVTAHHAPLVAESALRKLPQNLQDEVRDQQHAALLTLQFEDGTTLDTCAPLGPKRLSDSLELANGETLAPETGDPESPALNLSAAQPKAAVVPESSGRSWEAKETSYPMTGERGIDFVLADTTGTAQIRIICRDGKFRKWYVGTDRVLDSDTSDNVFYRLRLDDQKSSSKVGGRSVDFHALFGDKGTLKKLLTSKRALFDLPVYLQGNVIWTFEIAPIDSSNLQAACGQL